MSAGVWTGKPNIPHPNPEIKVNKIKSQQPR